MPHFSLKLAKTLVVGVTSLFLVGWGSVGQAQVEGDEEMQRAMVFLQLAHFESGESRMDDADRGVAAFDNFMKAMDEEKLFFLASEVDVMEALYQGTWIDDVRRGNSHPGQRIREALHKRIDLIEDRLAEIVAEAWEKAEAGEEGKQFWEEWAEDLGELGGRWVQRAIYEIDAEQKRRAGGGGQDAEQDDVASVVEERLGVWLAVLREMEREDAEVAFFNALAATYDPHTELFGYNDRDAVLEEISQNMSGVGISLKKDGPHVVIERVFHWGEAARSGMLQRGDRILGIGEGRTGKIEETFGLPESEVARRIRGVEGTFLRLEVARAEHDWTSRIVTLERKPLEMEAGRTKGAVIKKDGVAVGILTVPSFYGEEGEGSMSKDAQTIMRELLRQDIEALILDLRGDPGGLIHEAMRFARLFLPGKTVTLEQTAGGRVREMVASRGRGWWADRPLVVITDRNSASASELLAGAIQDHGAGVIVGDSQTYGKGSIQTMVFLGGNPWKRLLFGEMDGKILKVTIGRFYRPSGLSVQAVGVRPDVIISSASDLKQIGEGTEPFHLPAGYIDGIDTDKFVRSETIRKIAAASEKRRAGRPEFQKISDYIAKYNKKDLEEEVYLPDEDNLPQGVWQQGASIHTITNSGKLNTKDGKIADLYEGQPVAILPEINQDLTLEEALNIAVDLHRELKSQD